ncbi:DUF3592 domain-containing protein [filamentous cyanobacterium LEGE 11480]|uniref:DUF3592 domain-containing protein n=1 Tax=Romeriopsis navalis LEGE 11480 TaxID=2777977 RepID=A0A928VQJ8_9CYAN|nr:DUF3592 domain-containing protein [Romeriopsis navalis]MBE9030284.1 DUF3592 domain-containing protein [Romeriopsis navalis LEGE 11480]
MATKFKFDWGNFLQGGLLLYAMASLLMFDPIKSLGIALYEFSWVPTTAIVTQAATRNKATFTYQYTVNNQVFQSQRYAIAPRRKTAIEAIREFELGQAVNIYYNPRNPQQAIVMKRKLAPIFILFRLLFGGIFAWMATGLTFFEDVGGLINYRMEKEDQAALKFGAQYQERLDEPVEQLVPEIIRHLPKALRRSLGKYLNQQKRQGGASYLRSKTGLPPKLCEQIMEQLEHERNQ